MREIRLVGDLFGVFVIRKDEEKPEYEEIATPEKLTYWPPSIANIRGLLLHGQDASDYFSVELAKEGCKTHPIASSAVADFRKKPWVPSEPPIQAPSTRGKP